MEICTDDCINQNAKMLLCIFYFSIMAVICGKIKSQCIGFFIMLHYFDVIQFNVVSFLFSALCIFAWKIILKNIFTKASIKKSVKYGSHHNEIYTKTRVHQSLDHLRNH